MASAEVLSQVRKSRDIPGSSVGIRCKPNGTLRSGRIRARGHVPLGTGASSATFGLTPGSFFADVCSGSGVVAKCVRSAGYQCSEYDAKFEIEGDITRHAVRCILREEVKAGKCFGGMFAPPCSTFSPALFWTGPLRSTTRPLG